MENQGQSFAYLYHQALVNPKEVSTDDFNLLLSKYPYSQPLHFAWERRKFLRGELNKLGNRAILLASSPNWLHDYVQLPISDRAVYVDVVDDDYVPYDELEQEAEVSASVVSPTIGSNSTEEIADVQEPAAEEPTPVEEDSVAAEETVSIDEVATVETEEVKESSPIQEAAEETALPEEEPIEDEQPAAQKDITEHVDDVTFKSEEEIHQVPAQEELPQEEDTTSPIVEASLPSEEEVESVLPQEEKDAEEQQTLETLVQEGIGGGDYFALHAKEIQWETEAESNRVAVEQEEKTPEEDEVSLYNDELMPYSFRWWLHKTRLEYADTYQPFASPYLPVNKKSAFDPVDFDKIVLDQQIRENIIHLQKPEDKLSDEVKQREVNYTRVDKTSEVIERFIREEPQIQPPPADQLNMENKARKSSEEQFDLVTETLASIYASQAMYVKAIEVYKKLILRYPEKKSYFASRIKELEEKLY